MLPHLFHPFSHNLACIFCFSRSDIWQSAAVVWYYNVLSCFTILALVDPLPDYSLPLALHQSLGSTMSHVLVSSFPRNLQPPVAEEKKLKSRLCRLEPNPSGRLGDQSASKKGSKLHRRCWVTQIRSGSSLKSPHVCAHSWPESVRT